MLSKSNMKEIMIIDKVDKVIEKHFKTCFNRWKSRSIRGSDFSFDCVHLFYKINLNYVGSYTDCHDYIKKAQKRTINMINKKDNRRFQYAATVALLNL